MISIKKLLAGAVATTLALASSAEAQRPLRILFDDSHDTNGDDLDGNFSDFRDYVRDGGHLIEQLNGSPGAIKSYKLDCIDMFILVDPEAELEEEEIEALQKFVCGGGCLIVLGENGGAVHTASINTLLSPWGLALAGDTLTGAWNLAQPGEPLVAGVPPITTVGNWSSLTLSLDAVRLLGRNISGVKVGAARSGHDSVLLFGDSGFLEDAQFNPLDNESLLVDNILDACPRVHCPARDAKPGSVLLYPVHRSGDGYFTVLAVTNTDVRPQTPNDFGGSINLHFQYVNVVRNPANPFKPLGCSIFDRIEFLTPADTMSVLTTCHNAVAPGGQEGYVVVSAQDPSAFDVDVCHDQLVGSEFVLSASGVAYSIEAITIQCIGEKGCRTDRNYNDQLDFDGWEYRELADELIIDSFIAIGGSQLALVNLTGEHEDCNTVLFSVWNDNEFPLSATLRFNCWFDQPLALVSPLFTESFLRGTRHDPDELDINCDGIGDLETGWARIDSIDVSTVGGERVAHDGVIVGAITAGHMSAIDGGRLLWNSSNPQDNGTFEGRPYIYRNEREPR